MGIFLVAIKEKYDFSWNTHASESKKGLGFCNFMDKGYENAQLILTNILKLLQAFINVGSGFSSWLRSVFTFLPSLNILQVKWHVGYNKDNKDTIIQS